MSEQKIKVRVHTKLKKNDTVMITTGKDKGKTGRVLEIDFKTGRVMVEGLNIVKKAKRRKNQQDRGGIIELEAPLHLSNVQLVDRGGKPTRAAYRIEGDAKVRVSARTGDKI